MRRNVKLSSSLSSRECYLVVLCETQDCKIERHKHADSAFSMLHTLKKIY